jgi:hypothetical protein
MGNNTPVAEDNMTKIVLYKALCLCAFKITNGNTVKVQRFSFSKE